MIVLPTQIQPIFLILLLTTVFGQSQTNESDVNGTSYWPENASQPPSLESLLSPELFQRIVEVKEQIAQYPNALEKINTLTVSAVGINSKMLDLFISILPSQDEKAEILTAIEEYPQFVVPHGMEFFVDMINVKNLEEKLKVMVFFEDSDYLQIRIDSTSTRHDAESISRVAQSSELRNLLQLHKILLNVPSNSTWFEITSAPPLSRAQLMLLSRVIRHEFPEIAINLHRLEIELKLLAKGSFNASEFLPRIEKFLDKAKDVVEAFSRMAQEEENRYIPSRRRYFGEHLSNVKYYRETTESTRDALIELMRQFGVPSSCSVDGLQREIFGMLSQYIQRVASAVFKKH